MKRKKLKVSPELREEWAQNMQRLEETVKRLEMRAAAAEKREKP